MKTIGPRALYDLHPEPIALNLEASALAAKFQVKFEGLDI